MALESRRGHLASTGSSQRPGPARGRVRPLVAERSGARVTAMDEGLWFDIGRGTRLIGLVAAPPDHHRAILELVR